jgi:hypothetical protein
MIAETGLVAQRRSHRRARRRNRFAGLGILFHGVHPNSSAAKLRAGSTLRLRPSVATEIGRDRN